MKCLEKRIAASGIAGHHFFEKPDAAWWKVTDMKEPEECEHEDKREAFQSARAAVKLLLFTICAWKVKDNISRLRLDVRGESDDAVCAYEDWLEAIEAMNKLKNERMKVLNRGNRAKQVSHVDTGVHDALGKFLAHDTSFARHAKPWDHLVSWG